MYLARGGRLHSQNTKIFLCFGVSLLSSSISQSSMPYVSSLDPTRLRRQTGLKAIKSCVPFEQVNVVQESKHKEKSLSIRHSKMTITITVEKDGYYEVNGARQEPTVSLYVIPAASKLRRMLKDTKDLIVCPGVYDGLSARIAMEVGFKGLYMVRTWSSTQWTQC